MKTRCPDCQTVFRVTPEQLKARAGKVRCGQCQQVFNALDSLLETEAAAPLATTASAAAVVVTGPWQQAATVTPPVPPHAEHSAEEAAEVAPTPPAKRLFVEMDDDEPAMAAEPPPAVAPDLAPPHVEPQVDLMVGHHVEPFIGKQDTAAMSATAADVTLDFDTHETVAPAALADDADPEPTQVVDSEPSAPLSETAAQELGKATGLILPRETTEIPGYSKWAEGVMSSPSAGPLSLTDEKPARWPYILVSVLLLLTLLGQGIYRFRSELATTMPALQPLLASFSGVFGSTVPLPRHVELVSIEVSDLQNDPQHGNLLLLNATLRNRAVYAQSFPALELSLTDTQDAAIARRVLLPSEYLPARTLAAGGFAANSDLSVHLWLEARDIKASGYRLYVFYP